MYVRPSKCHHLGENQAQNFYKWGIKNLTKWHTGWCPYTFYSPVKCGQFILSKSLTTNKVKLFSLLGPVSDSEVQEIRDDTHRTHKKQVQDNLVVFPHLKGLCAPLYLMEPITDTLRKRWKLRLQDVSHTYPNLPALLLDIPRSLLWERLST